MKLIPKFKGIISNDYNNKIIIYSNTSSNIKYYYIINYLGIADLTIIEMSMFNRLISTFINLLCKREIINLDDEVRVKI